MVRTGKASPMGRRQEVSRRAAWWLHHVPSPACHPFSSPASLSGCRYLISWYISGAASSPWSLPKRKRQPPPQTLQYYRRPVSSGNHISHHFEKLVFWGVVAQQQPSEDSRDIAHRFFVSLAASTIKRPLPSPGKHHISNRHQHTHTHTNRQDGTSRRPRRRAPHPGNSLTSPSKKYPSNPPSSSTSTSSSPAPPPRSSPPPAPS